MLFAPSIISTIFRLHPLRDCFHIAYLLELMLMDPCVICYCAVGFIKSEGPLGFLKRYVEISLHLTYVDVIAIRNCRYFLSFPLKRRYDTLHCGVFVPLGCPVLEVGKRFYWMVCTFFTRLSCSYL